MPNPRLADPSILAHSRSVEEGERIVDSYFRDMSRSLGAAILEIVGEGNPIRAEHYGAIMRRVDREMNRIYPQEKSGGSPLEMEIAANANRGRVRSIKAAMIDIGKSIEKDRELVGAIREVSARNGNG